MVFVTRGVAIGRLRTDSIWRAPSVEIVLTIGALAALAWAAAVMLRGGLVGGALLVLLAGSCFGFAFFNLPAGPLPLTLDRLLLALLAGQYLLYRRWGWTERQPATKADYLLLTFLVLLAISTFTHDYNYHNRLPAAQLVFFFLMPSALYWIVRQARWSAPAHSGCSPRWRCSAFTSVSRRLPRRTGPGRSSCRATSARPRIRSFSAAGADRI